MTYAAGRALVGGLVLAAILTDGWGPPPVDAGEATKLTRALQAPIAEGESLAGIRVGMSERDVVAALGVPDEVETLPLRIETETLPFKPEVETVLLKVAGYEAASGIVLRVSFKEGWVAAILLVGYTPGARAAVSARVQGIGLGSELRAVRAAFGPGVDGRLWYPDRGIAFNPNIRHAPDDQPVYAILVLRRGPDDLVAAYGTLVR